MLEEFIKQTKHREREWQYPEQREFIAKKLAVTWCPKYVDWSHVYPFVSSDLNSINFRAPNVLKRYADNKEIQPKEMEQFICDNSDNNVIIKNNETIQHYLKNVGPIPEGKELMVFFMHGQQNKNLGDYLMYLYPDSVENRKELKESICRYKPTELTEDKILSDLGIFFKNISCNTCGGGGGGKKKQKEEEEEEEEKKQQEVKDGLTLERVPQKQGWDDQNYKNPILQTFANKNNLCGSRFPVDKMIKQMIIGSVAPSTDMSVLHGKYQQSTKIDASAKVEELLFYVDHMADEVIEKIIQTKEAQSFYKSIRKEEEKPKTDRDLVKMMIQAHLPTTKGGINLSKKHYDNTGELSKEVIKFLI